MIKHICMFKMKETANGKSGYENALEAAARLEGFDEKIPALKKIEVKVNSKDAPQDNFELVLICDFDDIDGLNEYQKHPVHVEFAKMLGEVRESRACIDYEF
ncbi:MAG: Dabb family protein [Lachnospiraceae bacterium]|nr:Dabb family protein [Lachnospiraceae bacterium]